MQQPKVDLLQFNDSAGLGFDRVQVLPGSTYQNNSTIWLVPGRDQFVHQRVVQSWQQLVAPMNQQRVLMFCMGDEVGIAYDRMIQSILDNPQFKDWKYIFTCETDNLLPPDAHVRLIETIESGPKYDAVSGIYFTKGDWNMPMAYGDPKEYRQTGVLNFRPRDIREALTAGEVMPVNGIAMGCALWRLDMFRELPKPWFVTVSDVVPDKGVVSMTQDLFLCRNAVQAGKKFAVDLRVKVGHMDLSNGIVF
jgi:hypothetical protein